MNYKTVGKRITALVLTLAVTISTFSTSLEVQAMTDLAQEEYEEIVSTYSVDDSILGFREYTKQFGAIYPEKSYEIEASDYVRYEEDDIATIPETFEDYEGVEGSSIVTSENGYIEYEVDVEESGFYDISLLYYPVEGNSAAIQRSFFVDGELPYRELSLIEFSRVWKNSITQTYTNDEGIVQKSWEQDNQGNDLKPTALEAPKWLTSFLFDSDGYITSQLSVYLEKGTHTISMLSLREPMLLRKIYLNNAKETQTYAQVKEQQDAQGAVTTTGQMIRIEAENVSTTSSQMLYPRQDQSSPAVYPSSTKELKNNSLGGTSWRSSGQWAEWEFEVQQSGYYDISMFVKQNFSRGIYVSRKIIIDGQVPFEELSDYGFVYGQNWREDTLQDEEGNAYQFYLEKGTHTIRMEVVLGDFSQIISEVQESVQDLNAIYRSVIRIIGVAPDKYRDYQIEANLPELEVQLQEVSDQLDHAITQLRAVAGEGSDKEAVLVTMRDQIDDLVVDQEKFTKVIAGFKVNIRATGNWITSAISQPLQIDRIYIHSTDTPVEIEHNSIWDKLVYEIVRLFYSFVIDYNQIGNVAEKDSEQKTITLWIGSGRDQANVIKSLIDETFSGDSNINVNVQLVDMNTLLRATLAGEGPDVAIQVANTTGIAGAVLATGNDTPVNYGLRNAVLDLSQFEDIEEVKSRFAQSAMTAFEFNGATYALPETQTFPMMFYRKDILAELGIEIPTTWDEVKVVMTVLAKNQMEFAMLPSEQIFAMLLYQNGGQYYSDDSLTSALDSDIAISTFKDYCEFYTDYKLDKETSAEERFRTGEAPIMIADYTTYNNLQVSAPDIKGLWEFAPVPGIEQEDGTINNATGCTGLASIIMSGTENPQECWEFLKWWTSAETQTLYGREMESLMGAAARVPTANLEALDSLPWPVDDYDALLAQLEQVQGIPQVPGGYYSWRNVNNAFYAVTTDDVSLFGVTTQSTSTPREELTEKINYVNDEITFKREEFNLPTAKD